MLETHPLSPGVKFTTSTTSPTPTATAKETASSLSSGKKAGISIGAVLGAFVLLAFGFFIGRRRRRRHHHQDITAPGPPEEAVEIVAPEMFQGNWAAGHYSPVSAQDGRGKLST
jgi:MYXO-CTERM domain-containing protein